jgi:hypothetical protein
MGDWRRLEDNIKVDVFEVPRRRYGINIKTYLLLCSPRHRFGDNINMDVCVRSCTPLPPHSVVYTGNHKV